MLKVIYRPRGRAGEYSEWAANLYRGCGHHCRYCYAPSAMQMQRSRFGQPEGRANIIDKLAADAASLQSQGTAVDVLLCFSCDPYQPLNDVLGLTRDAIKALHFYGHTVTILTKGGHRALPDMPLLTSADHFAVTLTCLDPALSVEWEPDAAAPQERVDTLKEAQARGIPTWVSLEPVLYPAESIALIEETHDFVDQYRLGRLNYHPRAAEIDWPSYAAEAVALLDHLGKPYYVKADLRPYIAVRGRDQRQRPCDADLAGPSAIPRSSEELM